MPLQVLVSYREHWGMLPPSGLSMEVSLAYSRSTIALWPPPLPAPTALTAVGHRRAFAPAARMAQPSLSGARNRACVHEVRWMQ